MSDPGAKFCFAMLLVWVFFEFGRPPQPLKIPLLISLISICCWLVRRNKQWIPQTKWFLVLLGVMAAGIGIAANTYAAFWSAWDMGIILLAICLPLQSLVDSPVRMRIWILTFLGVAFYVGAWAATHGGFGPSGSDGGQDENYVAAMMGLAIGLAYFSFFAEQEKLIKLVLVGMMVVYLAAIALGANPSRGGFLGLCAVGLYCLARSPKKMVGIGVVAVGALALIAVAGPSFWAEISTSGDTTSGTADVRIEIWKGGFRMFAANPILGVGAGNFRWVLDDYQTIEQFTKFGRSLGGSIIAHSLWVEMIAELGAAGVLATGALVISTWRGLGRVRDDAMQRSADGLEMLRFRCYADALRAGIIAILVNGLVLSLYYYSYLWLLLALGGALIYTYGQRAKVELAAPAVVQRTRGRQGAPRSGGGVPVPQPVAQGSRSLGRRR